MLSGLHTVADIFCCCCGQIVGWKYEAAHERSQKYKEGKFVLERGRIVDEVGLATEFYIDSRPSMSDGEDVQTKLGSNFISLNSVIDIQTTEKRCTAYEIIAIHGGIYLFLFTLCYTYIAGVHFELDFW